MPAFSLCPQCGDLITWPDTVPGKIEQCFKCLSKVKIIVTYDETAAKLLSNNIKEENLKNEHQNQQARI